VLALRLLLVSVILVALVGCELVASFDRDKIPLPGTGIPNIPEEIDAGRHDGGLPPLEDAGMDGGLDAGLDGGPSEAGTDAGPDAGPDAGSDAGADAGSDAGPADAGADAGDAGDAG
jgi:hypothetical protein